MQELTLGDIFSFLKQSGAIIQDGPVVELLEKTFHSRRSLQPEQIADLLQQLKQASGTPVQANTEPLIQPSLFARIPYPIAYVLEKTNEQYAELVQLLFLCDAIEIIVRWLVNVAVLAVCHENNQRIPTGIASSINDLIKRPSFGKWVGILRNLRAAIQEQKAWALQDSDIPSKQINDFITMRNGIAHGNIQGDIKPTLEKAAQLAEEIIEKTTQLHSLSFVASYQGQVLALIGPTMSSIQSPDGACPSDGLYCLFEGSYLPLPLLFELKEDSSSTPLIGSYISSKGDIKTPNDGSSLEYTEINGGELYHQGTASFLERFIELFQTNIKIPANEQWRELLHQAKSLPAEAWDADIRIIKAWRKARLQTTEKLPHILWFGGNSQTGRSTLLLSSLTDFQQEENNLFLFLHRFQSLRSLQADPPAELAEAEQGQKLLEIFLRRLRDAIFHWGLRELTSRELDYSLTSDDLIDDIEERLFEFLSIRKQSKQPFPLVCIGLDDVHHLPKALRSQLLTLMDRLYRAVSTKVRRGKDLFIEVNIVQVLFFVTGRSSITQDDADDSFTHTHPSIDWLYLVMEHLDLKKIKKSGAARLQEITTYNQWVHQNNPNDNGAHLPPLGHYGTMAILGAPDQNKQLLRAINSHQGTHPYVQEVCARANGNPLYVSTIAEKLANKTITIDAPLEELSPLSTYFSAKLQNEFINDERRILALILCLLYELKRPLTTSSLQMLNDSTLIPNPAQEEVILRSIYAAPGLLRAIPLETKNEDGTVQYAWEISTQDIAKSLTTNAQLSHTVQEAKLRIQYFQNNAANIEEGVELKEIFDKTSHSNAFLEVFRPLRSALHDRILEMEPKAEAQLLFHHSMSMLLETCAFWDAQKTWLQKSFEYEKQHALHKQATQLLDSGRYNGFWLRQKNAQHLPIFEHKRRSFPYPETVGNFIPLHNGYYVIKGMSRKGELLQLTLHHIDNNQALHTFDAYTEPILVDALCMPHPHLTSSFYIVIATQTKVNIHTWTSQDNRYLVSPVKTYDYQGDIASLCSYNQQAVMIFGTKASGKNWLTECIDLEQPNAPILTWQLKAGTAKQKPKNSMSCGDGWITNVSKDLFLLDNNQQVQALKLTGAPKNAYSLDNGAVWYWKGTNAKANCEVVHNGEHTLLSKDSARIMVVFPYQNDWLSVSITGVITFHKTNKTLDLFSLLQADPDLKTHYQSLWHAKRVEIKGGVLHHDTLVLYGTPSLLISIDVRQETDWVVQKWPLLHYGTGSITKAHMMKGSFENYQELLFTQSDDNDIRLWCLQQRKCLGLFRGHDNKIKTIQQYGSQLLSADESKNVSIWNINSSCTSQLASSPAQAPAYILSTTSFGSDVWTFGTKAQYSIWPTKAAGWTPELASSTEKIRPLTDPEGQKYIGVTDIENLSKSSFIRTTRKKLIHICRQTQKVQDITPEETKIEGFVSLQLTDDCYLGTFSADGIWVFDAQGEIRHTLQSEEKITGLAASHHPQTLLFAAKDGTESKQQNIYEWNVVSNESRLLYTVSQEAAIKGMFAAPDGRILCWDAGNSRPTNLYLLEKKVVHGPFQNPNVRRAPKYVTVESDGLVFATKDSPYRWRLGWTVSTIITETEDDEPHEESKRELTLQPIDSVTYVLDNFTNVLGVQRANTPHLTAETLPIFVEAAKHGLNLFYHHNNKTHVLVWSGEMMRDFSAGNLFENGTMTVKKNRSLIVLQLMKGKQEVPLQALFS